MGKQRISGGRSAVAQDTYKSSERTMNGEMTVLMTLNDSGLKKGLTAKHHR